MEGVSPPARDMDASIQALFQLRGEPRRSGSPPLRSRPRARALEVIVKSTDRVLCLFASLVRADREISHGNISEMLKISKEIKPTVRTGPLLSLEFYSAPRLAQSMLAGLESGARRTFWTAGCHLT